MLVSANAVSDPDIYKCSDAEGHILLTDKPCGPGLTVLVPNNSAAALPQDTPANPAAAALPAFAPETASDTATLDEPPARVVIRAPSPGSLLHAKPLRRALAIDVDTLKQARLAMLSDDAAWSSRRALRD